MYGAGFRGRAHHLVPNNLSERPGENNQDGGIESRLDNGGPEMTGSYQTRRFTWGVLMIRGRYLCFVLYGVIALCDLS